MEDILSKIVKEAQISKLSNLTAACYATQGIYMISPVWLRFNEFIISELICDKTLFIKCPMSEVHRKCLSVFELGLSPSNSLKIQKLSIAGMQIMIRDKIYWTVDSNDPNEQLPIQMCNCIGTVIKGHKEKIQIELLSLITELSSQLTFLLSLETIEEIITISSGLYSCDTIASKLEMSIELASSQSTFQYCHFVIKQTGLNFSDIFEDDIFPLLNFICALIQSDSSNSNCKSMLLKCIHSVLLSIPNDSSAFIESFISFIW